MTRRETIGQAEIERALKACKRAGFERARVHINLREQTIDILLGEDGPSTIGNAYDQWKARKRSNDSQTG